jgi:DNA-directed RNA polymerase specialized sigma24 family protein
MNEQKTLVDALRACRMQHEVIEAYEARIARLNAMATRTTPPYSNNPSSGGGNQDAKMSAKAAAMDLEAELQKLKAERAAVVEDLRPQIAHLPLNFREVIRLRDLVGLSWQEVADDMGYSERWCKQLQQTAYLRLGNTSLRTHDKSIATSPLSIGLCHRGRLDSRQPTLHSNRQHVDG